MMQCSACGRSLTADDRFCPSCGAAAPTETPHTEARTTWTCTACGTEMTDADARFCRSCGAAAPARCAQCGAALEPDGAFCAACGAATGLAGADTAATVVQPPPAAATVAAASPTPAPTVVQPAPPQATTPPTPPPAPSPGAPAGGAGGRRTLVIVAVVAAVAALAVIAGVVLLTRDKDDSGSGPTGPSFTEQVSEALQPVYAPQKRMRKNVKAFRPRGDRVIQVAQRRLRVCTRCARTLDEQVADAQAAVKAIEPATHQERAARGALLDALHAQHMFARAIKKLPSEALEIQDTNAAEVEEWLTAAETAYGEFTTAYQALPDASQYPLKQMPIEARDARHLKMVATRMAKERALRDFLVSAGNVMEYMSSGADELHDAVTGVLDVQGNTSRIEPGDAIPMIDDVLDNRQDSLSQANSLDVPDDSRARQVQSLLQQSLQYSIEADRDYIRWLENASDYFYDDPVGWYSRSPKSFDGYDDAVSAGNSAGSYKRQLCALVNKLSRPLGIKANWSSGGI